MYVTRPYALDARQEAATVRELADRTEIIDALYRFALGRDLKDRELLESAFTEDAEFDFRPVAGRLGLDLPLMTGRDMITGVVLNPGIPLDTTHAVTNCRTEIDQDAARLTALVEAQHLPGADHGRHLLLKNLYAVDLVRAGSHWRMRRVHVENVWYTGEPGVLIGR
ncbi:nuclear transport factor 2 family protein [Streptomyces sp. Ru71]|uniref:nuclear transport factor 2 family protein n=1 Tax=Streptomyces sp. Ru71 TaxID=2080746 RepID=UPI000CDDEE2B|nr:nuclear transport factor 2 family protein [Streptomyces sp. Ru71]POX56997.1 nuclear transport factor 2 family protein [Streptomyces sp. Ru71]